MAFLSFVLKKLAKNAVKKNLAIQRGAIEQQQQTFKSILDLGSKSLFGKRFGLNSNIQYNL